jgi:WD40 repeat protein
VEAEPLGEAPYKGLAPYEEADWPYFSGRVEDCELITTNLIGSRLTVFYGPSGVGKSSVLDAGVSHYVNDMLAEESRAEVEHPEFAVAVFRFWLDDPIPGLLALVRDNVERVAGRNLPDDGVDGSASLADALEWMAETSGLTILLVLDQFEEFLLYQPETLGPGSFGDQLPELVLRPNLRVHVMISIREDALAKLDRFKGRVPRLFENTLRLDPLDREQARQAIEKPITTYNTKHELCADPIRPEPALVEAVLDGVKVGAIGLDTEGRGKVDLPAGKDFTVPAGLSRPIEAPHLQLVMTRVWDVERRLDSRWLRHQTFIDLGRADGIVKMHLDDVLKRLPWSEQNVAEEVLTYLVTPSATKIALDTSDLTDKTGCSAERVVAVLERLAKDDCRVVRRLEGAGQTPTRYEIFHDVLARVIVNDYVPRIKRRRFQRWLGGMVALLIVVVGLGGLATLEWLAAREAKYKAEEAAGKVKKAYDELRDANQKIEIQARTALSRQLGLQARSAINERFDLALLLGVEALHQDPETWEARDGLMRVLNPRLGFPLNVDEGRVSGVSFAADGKTLAAGFAKSETGGVVLWDVLHRERLGTPLKVDEDRVSSVSLAPEGKTLAAGFEKGNAGGVVLWDVARRERMGDPLKVVEGDLTSVSFARDGKTLAAGFNKGGTGGVVLWDVARRERLGTPLKVDEGNVSSITFPADGKTLAAGFRRFQAGGVVLWDVSQRKRLGSPLKVEEGRVLSVSFAADGKTLAAGYYKGEAGGVVLWDVSQRERLGAPLKVDEGRVWSVSFEPEGKTLAAGFAKGGAGGVVLWDVPRRERLSAPLKVDEGQVMSVSFAPDGRSVASGYAFGDRGGVMLWDLDPKSWMRQACRIANRNLSWDEWQAYVGRDVPYHKTCPELPEGTGVAQAFEAQAEGR